MSARHDIPPSCIIETLTLIFTYYITLELICTGQFLLRLPETIIFAIIEKVVRGLGRYNFVSC